MTFSEEKRPRPAPFGSADRTAARPAHSNAHKAPGPEFSKAWWRPLICLAVCGGIVGLAYRSWRHSDALVVYTRGGNVQGVGSHRAASCSPSATCHADRKRGLTAEFASLTPAEGEELFNDVYRRWDRRREFVGFGGAMSARGDLTGDATHVALVVPHWFIAVLCCCQSCGGPSGPARRWRRVGRRTGKRLCWNCGYPLVHEPERCPECGEAVAAQGRAGAAGVAAP